MASAFMLFLMVPVQAAGTETLATESASAVDDATKANLLMARLDEIKAMDFAAMTKAERKNTRKEVRDIKRELKAISGGVYLSATALIIILLILILVT